MRSSTNMGGGRGGRTGFDYSDCTLDDINTLRRILRESRVIAVVGLSADWYRPSYFAAKYMQEHGYRVIPVNPKYPEILGEKCYRSLRDIPEKVDLVDVFRKSTDDADRRRCHRHWRQGPVAATRREERGGGRKG